jgi:hypothetical protein
VTPESTFPTTATPTTTDTTAVTPTPRVTPPTKTTTSTTKTKTTPTPTIKAVPITLAKDAVAAYDPLTRIVSATDPKSATDNDPSTLFTLNTKPSSDGVQAGLTVDLGTVGKVTRIKLQTPTPGFSVEIYGAPGPTTTSGPAIPPTLTDPRWKHLHNQRDIGSVDGDAQIRLGLHGKGVSSYRYLLIWVTNPPPVAPGTRDVPDTTTVPATTPAPTPTATTTATTATTPPPPVTTTTTVVPPPTTPTTTPPAPAGATVSFAELSLFG